MSTTLRTALPNSFPGPSKPWDTEDESAAHDQTKVSIDEGNKFDVRPFRLLVDHIEDDSNAGIPPPLPPPLQLPLTWRPSTLARAIESNDSIPEHKMVLELESIPWTEQDRESLTRLRQLGHGSLGHVEECGLAKDGEARSSVARKRIEIPRNRGKRRIDLAEKEVETLKSLVHPHIITLLDSWEMFCEEDRKTYYNIVMLPVGDSNLQTLMGDFEPDFLPTQSLLVQDSKNSTLLLSFLNLAKWTPCLASALEYIHREGIRHQDIKPSNIVYRGGDVYFTDFGSAGRFDPGCTTSTESPAWFSKRYAAPEMLPDPYDDIQWQRHGRSADVFSLGSVMMEMAVCLMGTSINTFQDFCCDDASLNTCIYAYALESVQEWPYHSPRGSWVRIVSKIQALAWELYDYCTEKMMAFEKPTRPSAGEVLTWTRQWERRFNTVARRLHRGYSSCCMCGPPFEQFMLRNKDRYRPPYLLLPP